MRWRSVWLAASSSLVLAGCGHSTAASTTKPPPRIPADVAQRLAADADAVASATGCGARKPAARLQTDVIASVAQIPQRYREQLMSAANDVLSRIPECLPPTQGHGKHKGHKKKHKERNEND